jgi:hypothetical protein
MKQLGRRGRRVSPARWLEMLESRFGAFEALAYASLALARQDDPEGDQPPMDKQTAEAILEFGDDVRRAGRAAARWAATEGASARQSPR